MRTFAPIYLEQQIIRGFPILRLREDIIVDTKDRRRLPSGRQLLSCRRDDLIKMLMRLGVNINKKDKQFTQQVLTKMLSDLLIQRELEVITKKERECFIFFNFTASV